MVDNIEQTEDPITPPLPKGFKVIKKEKSPPPLPSGFNPIKKKDSSESISTTTNQSLASEPKVGSLDSVESKGFPKLDTNSIAPGDGIQPKAEVTKEMKTLDSSINLSAEKPLPKINTKLKGYLDQNKANIQRKSDLESELKGVEITPENQEEISKKATELADLNTQFQQTESVVKEMKERKANYSKISSLTNKFLTGSSQLGADIASVPELAYDVFSAPQNAVSDLLDIPSLHTDSDKFKKTIGVNNSIKDYYRKEVVKLREEAQKTDLKHSAGVYDSFVNGDYASGFDQLTNSFSESLPMTASIMVGGAYVKAPQLMAASSMVFGAGKNEKLKEENPEMNANVRVANALATGFIQGAAETLGSGSIGAAAKGIVAREGGQKAVAILKDGLVKYYKGALQKNPLLASMSGEGLEEAFQGVAENAVDVSTGVKPQDFNIWSTAVDDFIGGAFGGAVFGGGLQGLSQIANYQDKNAVKANSKKIFSLQNELSNPEFSPEIKVQINNTIDGLVNQNRKLVQKNVDHVENLPESVRNKLIESISTIETAKSKANEIKLDQSISPQNKQILLDNLKAEHKTAIETKNGILEGRTTEVDVMPLKQQDKLKKQALKELTEELNPDGKKNITITNEQITERANKINSKNVKDAETQSAVAETKPKTEAEIQKPTEASKVEEPTLMNEGSIEKNQPVVEQTTADTKEPTAEVSSVPSVSEIEKLESDYNSKNVDELVNLKKELYPNPDIETPMSVEEKLLNKVIAKKFSDKNAEIKAKHKEADARKANGNTLADGNVQSGVEPVGEARTTESKATSKESVSSSIDGGESKGDIKVIYLDHAKSQIEKGVLQWNGDAGTERINLGISWADIRKGETDIKRGKTETVPAKRLIEALKIAKEKGGYENIQGRGGIINKQFVSLEDIQKSTNEYNLTDSEQKEVDTYEIELAKEYDDYVNSFDEKTQNDILENYENRETKDDTGKVEPDTSVGESKNDVSDKKEPKKPTEKKSSNERIKAANAKVDDWKNAVKGIDEIFGIKIKVDDIDGLTKQGVDIIDVIANIVKQAIAAGINIDEAISKTIEHLKKSMDFDVNIDDVKERISPKKEKETFKRKDGKKSLLGRLIEGGNSKEIEKTLSDLGEDYNIRNQKEADDFANAFIDKVGIGEALKSAKDGLIKNNDVKYLVYAEGLDRLSKEIDDKVNLEDREQLIEQFKSISDEFDNEVRNAGQGISVLNYIYNKNQSLKYSLSKLISDYKKNDVNGEIPKEVKEEFEALSAKLKDVESKIKDAEERAKKAEDELAIKNIQEDIDRQKSNSTKNKSGLTQKEQIRKRELKNKFFGRLNDVTSVATMLADPEFREYLGLTFKAAKGDLTNFSNQIIKEIGNGAKKHLPNLFKEAENINSETSKKEAKVTVGKDGKIKITVQVFRDYVEARETDIDVIASKIKEDISEEYPDADIRDIRDALTGYGKQINPNRDEITAKINKLKEYGRLLSAYEDVKNGEMPKKSGLKRMKPEQQSRELRKEINRLAKELELESVDLETQWATAIDKVKSNLKNQIEDLDKQIDNGEKRKVERTSIKLDSEAEALKFERDEKRKILDDLVGKPELSEEQKLEKAEKSLEKSIENIQKEIDTNNIDYKEKPTPLKSEKLDALRAKKKTLIEVKNQLREESGLVEAKRLKTAKTRVKNQIEDLQTKIKNKDFAKKEIKPILADNELNNLRAEKEKLYDHFEKLKYIQELKNRSTARKYADASLEALGLARAVKASLDLGLIGIQLRGFTYSELLRNPKELGKKFLKLFGAIGSQSKTDKAMSQLIGHPLYGLAKKLDIGVTHPDLRNEVREEMASGNLMNIIWNTPAILTKTLGGKQITDAKKKSLGDTIIDGLKKQYNKFAKNKIDITEKEKISRAEQWKNANLFEAVERGLSTYGNQLRFEEFVRGVDRLKAEGKDEINHKEDYEALASYIRTFSGRAKPAGFEMNQKLLNVFFFSFKNAVSVFQQLNPYYMGFELNKANLQKGIYKPTVASKMAMATMIKSVTSTAATMLFMTAAYNAFKDDDDDELTVETDPKSSDFGKLKIGDLRYDPWGGYIPLITLYARLWSEEVKKADGSTYKMGEERFGIENRFDATSRFLINKESPGFQMFHHYMSSKEVKNKETGKMERVNNFGQTLSEDEAFSLYPIFLGSVRDAIKEDKEGVQSVLTAYSILGLGNVQNYSSSASSKKGNSGKSFGPKPPSPPKPPTR